MGTKDLQDTLKVPTVDHASSSESSRRSDDAALTSKPCTHTSDTNDASCISSNRNIISSNNKGVANINNTHSNNQTANTNCYPAASTTMTEITTTTTATTTPSLNHSKAQVIIIPATPASTVATNAAKKIRRAFSMPRNPFQWSRKFKTSGGGGIGKTSGDTPSSGGIGGSGSNSALTACVGGGARHGSIVSINSYTAMCKENTSGGNVEGFAADAPTTQRQDKKNNATGNSTSGSNRVFRRSSLRKFINRIAQHVSSTVNIGAHKQAASSQANSLSSTDRVPPIGGYQWPADQTPGVTGLKNHGNTCFMNAVLQCLSHTDILAEYFVLDQYKSDLKRRNKINSRKFGTKGELTEQLANVLKALWTCRNESDHSTSFKAVVDRYGSQFRSSTQHDAQEFLFWLLDKVHEDLNTATKRRYKSVKNSYGRPDEVIAAETLANHIRCNNSFVQAVFQAQFRSSLTCPRCKKQSNTFDPFHCISVQLPQVTQQTIFVTVLYNKQLPRQVKLGLTVPAGSPIVALREQLHADTGIASEHMVLVDINETGFGRVYYDTQPISTLADMETIYCIEVPPEEDVETEDEKSNENSNTNIINNDITTSNTAAPPKPKTTTTKIHASADLLLLISNVRTLKKPETDAAAADRIERFGTPFCLRAPRDATYTELQKKLLREMSSLLKPDVFAYSTPLSEMFQIRLQDPSADPDTYLEQVEHPLLTEMIDLALSVLSAEAGPAHIKLLLEWPDPEAHFVDLVTMPPLVEHESVARLMEQRSQDTSALTLEQCLEHYTKAETLSAEDAWRCPHCQQYLPVVKTLGLWSLPDILVVHFKRFRQHQVKGSNAAKLTTMVKFPLTAFDMAPHLAKGTRENCVEMSLNCATAGYTRPSPWKKSTRTSDSRSSTLESTRRETRYDLYAVCYHQGDTLETGHYTAACKNPYDHQWYKFDDQRVSRVPNDSIEQDIINNEAYMLFYQRRRTDVAECSGSSSTSGEHWISKIAPAPQISTQIGEKLTAACSMATTTATSSSNAMAVASKTSDENLLEKAVTKSVIILGKEDEKDENYIETAAATTTTYVPKRNEPVQVVVIENAERKVLADSESLKYADEGAEEADIDADELDVLEKLTPTESSSPNEEEEEDNHIFVMDEDCKLKQDDNDITAEATKQPCVFVATVMTPTLIKSKFEIEVGTNVTITGDNGKLQPDPVVSDPVLINGTCLSSISNPQKNSGSPGDGALINSPTSSTPSLSSPLSSRSTPPNNSTYVASTAHLQTKFNGYSSASTIATTAASVTNCNESLLSSSLKSNSSSIIAAATAAHANDLQLSRHHLYQNGSRSSVSVVEHATSSCTQQSPHHTRGLNLRHSFSTSSNYKLKECGDTLSSMLRNTANSCSKDTLIFIDQQSHHHHHHHNHNHHSLIEDDDDTFMGSRSLWISPVTPHKLITVSPKN